MVDISAEIQRLLAQSGISMSTLSRQAQIDRSTLYKLASGQRLPTAEQAEALLLCLHATPAQRRTLLQAIEQQRLAPGQRRCSAAVQRLLQTLFAPAAPSLNPPPVPRGRSACGRRCLRGGARAGAAV